MHRSAPPCAPRTVPASLALAAACALLAAGCKSVECGAGTVEKVDPVTTAVQCVPAVNGQGPAIPCDVDAGARLVGGICQGDPSQYPTCGPGTIVDEKTGACVPGMNTGTPTPPPCAKPSDPKKMCLNGVVRMLKDFSFTKGRQLEVRAYDPFAFLVVPPLVREVASFVDRLPGDAALTRIQEGLRSTSPGTTFTGMRDSLAAAFCLASGL